MGLGGVRSRGLELGVGGDVWETFFLILFLTKRDVPPPVVAGTITYVTKILRGWVSEKVWITQKRGGIVDEDRSWV